MLIPKCVDANFIVKRAGELAASTGHQIYGNWLVCQNNNGTATLPAACVVAFVVRPIAPAARVPALASRGLSTEQPAQEESRAHGSSFPGWG